MQKNVVMMVCNAFTLSIPRGKSNYIDILNVIRSRSI